MDNKKWSKKFSTIFWWVLAFLPLFTALISMLGYNFARLNGITSIQEISDYYGDNGFNQFNYFLDLQFNQGQLGTFSNFIPSFLSDFYEDLFSIIINDADKYFETWWQLFAWATWIFILHVIFDIIVWLPCFLHDLIDRFKK